MYALSNFPTHQKNNMLPIKVLFFSILFFSGCNQETNNNHVLSFAPEGVTENPREVIQIRFEKPVDENIRKQSANQNPFVTIEPQISFRTAWEDPQTLFLIPTEDLKPSTQYTVALRSPLTPSTGANEFKFVHKPTKVAFVEGVSSFDSALQPNIQVHFNQEVKPEQVATHCFVLTQDNKKHFFSLAQRDENQEIESEDWEQNTSFQLKESLLPSQTYSFVCEGITGRDGNVPMLDKYVYTFQTVGLFEATVLAPEQDSQPASDRVLISIGFSNQPNISKEELRKHLTIEPMVEDLYGGSFTYVPPYKYSVRLQLKKETQYKVELKSQLKDKHGQTLKSPLSFSFKTSGPEPKLNFETGQYALEANLPGFPLWAKNIRNYNAKCSFIPKGKIPKLLTSSLDYDPWYSAGSSPYNDFKDLKIKTVEKSFQIPYSNDQWEKVDVPLHSLCKKKNKYGLFYASFDSNDLPKPDSNSRYWRDSNRGVLVNVTNLGVLLKVGPASGFAWVSQISDAKPVEGAKVTLFSPNGKRVFRGKTTSDGMIQFPGSTQLLKTADADDKDELEEDGYGYYSDWSAMRAQRMIVIVEKDDDFAIVDGNWANGIQLWNFGVSQERRSGPTELRAFIHTDRGLYRPGEKVHFKGWVREISLGQTPKLPKNKWVTLFVENVAGETLFQKRIKISSFGSFDFNYKLPKGALLGDYFVTATIGKKNFRQKFQVEEFRKASFKVDLHMKERHVQMGQKIAADVDAQYLFGAPVMDAHVEWLVERRDHALRFSKFPEYTFADLQTDGYSYDYGYHEEAYLNFVSDGHGETDAQGKYQFKFKNPQKGFSKPQDYLVQATVTDATDQSFTKQSVITSHPTDFYLGLHTQEYVQAVHMPFAIGLVALKPDGSQTSTPAKLHYIKSNWVCEKNYGPYYNRNCKTVYKNIWTRDVEIPATGTLTEKILPKIPGEFIIRAEATDSRGKKVTASYYTYILGEGEAFWSGDESTRMSLIFSKKAYEPGDVARIVPKTHLKNFTALVTVERNGVLDSFVKHLTSASEGIELPITEAYAPNVFVSIAAVSGRSNAQDNGRPEFQMGISEIAVSPDQNRLNVIIKTDKPSYEPRQQVKGTVHITSNGKPVQADVSLSAADEGVLQIIAYKTPDPMFKFYKNWGLGLDPSTNWNRILRIQPLWDRIQNSPGMDSGPSMDTTMIRSRFVSSAFWEPSLKTNAKGEASFTFEAPDNLTSFRLMVAAADSASRFGAGETNITVRKPLLLKSVLPRFLTAGDKTEVGVMVHNYTGEEASVKIKASLKGVKPKSRKKEITLSSNQNKRVRFPITAGTSSKSTFQFEAHAALSNSKSATDGLQQSIPIYQPISTNKKNLFSNQFQHEQSVEIQWDKKADLKKSTLSISADSTGLSELKESLKYLIHYPYGCLEQTLSGLIPLFKIQEFSKLLDLKTLRGPKLQTFIEGGMAKVIRHQHADGHFSFWPDSTTYPFLTVYALFGMLEAEKAQVIVPKRSLNLAVQAIKTWSNSTLSDHDNASDLPMAAFLLAEMKQADTGLIARLFDTRKNLDIFGAAFLLRAMHLVDSHSKMAPTYSIQIQTLLSELETKVQINQQNLTFSSSQNLKSYFGTQVRSTAALLSALLQIQPDHPWVNPLVQSLRHQKQNSGRWNNTQDNLYALVALADYARQQNKTKTTLKVSIPGAKPIVKTLSGNRTFQFEKPLHTLEQGTLTFSSTKPVYLSAILTETFVDNQKTPIEEGLTIERIFRHPKDKTPAIETKVGKLIETVVNIYTPEDRRNIAVVIPLPAGFESTQETKEMNKKDFNQHRSRYGYNDNIWDRIEFRDDRIEAFADNIPQGTHNLVFQVRATLPGTFTARAASAEAMYKPEVYGRTVKQVVEIKRQ